MPKNWLILSVAWALVLIPLLLSSDSEATKKKKSPRADSVVALMPLDPATGVAVWYHGCCQCELWHEVTLRLVVLEAGRLAVEETWTVDEQRTRRERLKRFGSELMAPRHPFAGADQRGPGRDPWPE